MFYLLFLHSEELLESLASYTEKSIKNFIAKVFFLSLNDKQQIGSICTKSSGWIIDFVKESKNIYSRFRSICLQALNTKRKHFRNFYRCLFWYGTVYVLCEKERGTETKSLRVLQMQVVIEKIQKIDTERKRDLRLESKLEKLTTLVSFIGILLITLDLVDTTLLEISAHPITLFAGGLVLFKIVTFYYRCQSKPYLCRFLTKAPYK